MSLTQPTMIPTMVGEIAVDQLGAVLTHEHLFVTSPEVPSQLATFDEETEVRRAIEALQIAHASGIGTIVDLTVIGLGRRLAPMIRVAQATEVNIICATGLYTYCDLPQYFALRPPPKGDAERDILTELFVSDINEGIESTNVRAGVLKCATDTPGLTRDVTRVLKAVAAAHRITAAPIVTHSDARSHQGLNQIAVLSDNGVDLERVIIGHSGDSDDLEYLTKLLQAKVTLGMDRFGFDFSLDPQRRIDIVAKLCRLGFASQLVLSHDAASYIDWLDPNLRDARLPNWNYHFISTSVLEGLRRDGVTDEMITTMMVDNPARIFRRRTKPEVAPPPP